MERFESKISRELLDLQNKSMVIKSILKSPEEKIRDFGFELVEIAKNNSLKQAFKKAEARALEIGFYGEMAESFGKACRFLAMIQRDYGEEKLLEFLE